MTGAFAFLSPWMLAGLAVLPLLWLLLRLTPPKPQTLDFPPTRILLGLTDEDRTPARTPWWLTLLRLALAALVILALAEPVLKPQERLTAGEGPLLVVLDNGWDSAPDFAARAGAAAAAITEAKRDGRPVALLATAEPEAQALEPGAASEAEDRLAALSPRPYSGNRAALAERLTQAYGERAADVVWIAGRLDNDDAGALAGALGRAANSAILVNADRPLTALRPPQNATDRARVSVERVGGGGEAIVAGFDAEGRRIVEAPVTLDAQGKGTAEIAMPAEIRNALTRFSVAGEESAGAVQILDASWRRKSVGLIVGEAGDAAQPLLAPLTYVERALASQVDLFRPDAAGTAQAVRALIERRVSLIVLTDTGTLPAETVQALANWVEKGGTLVRFASPRLAASDAALLPVRLREGERSLGGSLSWETPRAIGAFSPEGPFRAIEVPEDVRVNRQILADPDTIGEAQVWAELEDGTPLVTAAGRGAGRTVLFHVTADPRWSNLPLSGAFVEMLTALVETSTAMGDADRSGARQAGAAGAEAQAATAWKPVSTLDGFGRLGAPDPRAALVADIDAARPSAETPPGLYEREGASRALNVLDAATSLKPLDAGALGWRGEVRALTPQESTPLWPWLLALAALLAALDAIAVLALTGRLLPSRVIAPRAGVAALALAFTLTLAPDISRAADEDTTKALDATLTTRLAYVLTGDSEVDETSRAGLDGLSQYLAGRTAFEPGEPLGIDLETDELAFYAFLYWPVVAGAEPPPADVMAKVDAFMKNGGTIVFDTRDAGGMVAPGSFAGSPEADTLRALLANVDVPPIEPVPPDHVLTKAFYLLREFPGRWRDSELWVEALEAASDPSRPARGGDGVSSIMITGNDLAAAWAIGEDGRFLYPTVPADPRQRELAFRAGVNIVMYTLTGNYKTDQVHIPALLERLGQ